MRYGQQPGGPPAPGAPPGPDWRYAPPPARTSAKTWWGVGAAIATAIALAAAALVVGIVDLTRSSTSSAPAASAPTASAPTSASATDTTAADRALCTAIAPLMAESDRVSNAYMNLGPAGSPSRDAALPKYIADTQDWVKRIQPVLDDHPDISPFLKRSLQRFIDDRELLAADLVPGPLEQYDQEIWSDSMAAYGGPLSVCYKLGIKW
jgi:hypothetical protein